ncbi:MAG TPA: hypothetical protein VM432_14770 [Bdellovibrionales bacterium]|nr:hypothetical protein [Bdellovibrionales bacterium]
MASASDTRSGLTSRLYKPPPLIESLGMTTQAPLVVYLHGLNTYGDNLVRIGPVIFGTMSEHLQEGFEKRGMEFVAVEGMGWDAPEIQAQEALAFLKSKGLTDRPVHLLGQSVGGLVARALAKIWPKENGVLSIVTFGTPHYGAHVAEHSLELHLRAPTLYKTLKTFGYDASTRSKTFGHFTRASLEKFNANTPTPAGVQCTSFVCSVPKDELTLPYQLIHGKFHPTPTTESDGFIFCESQKWESYRGPYKLDHFAQMGFFLFLRKKNREAARREFDRMLDDMAKMIQGVQANDLKREAFQPKKNP